MMPSDQHNAAAPRAVIVAAKVLDGNRRILALQKALVDAGWTVDVFAMVPTPYGSSIIGLGGPGKAERWMDRISRFGAPGHWIAAGLRRSDRMRYAADRRSRFFRDLDKQAAIFAQADLVIAQDSFATEWAAQVLPPDTLLIADLVEDIKDRSYAALETPSLDLLVRRPDAIVTVSDGLKRRLIGFGAKPERVSIVMNSLPLGAVGRVLGDGNGPDLIAAGTLYPDIGLDHLIAVSEHAGLSLLIVGACPDEGFARHIRSLIASTAPERIEWRGALPSDELTRQVGNAGALVIPFTPSRANFAHAMPNRLFTALAVGTPILAQKGLDLADWVEARGVGVAVDFEEPDLAADVVKAFLDEGVRKLRSEAALQTAKEIAWETQTEGFLATVAALKGAR